MAQMILPALMLGGTALSAIGTMQQGKAQKRMAEFEAKQMEANAKKVEAAGAQDAIEKRRQTELMLSRAQAAAGATGFSAVSPDVLSILGGISQEGDRAFQTELFNSRDQANQMRAQAGATRYSGAIAKKASTVSALATGISGAADAGGLYFGQSTKFGFGDMFRAGGRKTGFE